MGSRRITPLSLSDADAFVRTHHTTHRHHPRAKFHRFSLGLLDGDNLIGAIIVGTPMSRWHDPEQVAEVLRLATTGAHNSSSQLLSAAVRVCREMGYARLMMTVGKHEATAPSFLRAAGLHFDGTTSGDPWDHASRKDTRTRDDREPKGPKDRWIVQLAEVEKRVRRSRLRKCVGCGLGLPADARPNRRACNVTCRKRAQRRKSLRVVER